MSRRVRTNLGFAFAATGDLRRAAHEFEMGGTAAEAKNNLGFAYERRGDLRHAYDLYLEATTLDPKSTHARSNLVHAAQVLGGSVAVVPETATVAPPTPVGGEPTAPALPFVGPPQPSLASSPKTVPTPQQKDVRP